MARDHQYNLDPNVNAARIVGEATAGDDRLPAEVEAAWQAWSAHIQNVDQRGLRSKLANRQLSEFR